MVVTSQFWITFCHIFVVSFFLLLMDSLYTYLVLKSDIQFYLFIIIITSIGTRSNEQFTQCDQSNNSCVGTQGK